MTNIFSEDMLGPHKLTYAPIIDVAHPFDKDVNGIAFCIDDKWFIAFEDPNDGYRSSLGALISGITPDCCRTEYINQSVIGRMAENGEYEENDILEYINSDNGLPILRVGTGNTNDYYPYFVGEWIPQNLTQNQ